MRKVAPLIISSESNLAKDR